MTNVSDLTNAIRAKYKALMEDGQSIPVLYDNEPDNPSLNTGTWSRFSIRPGESTQAAFRRFRYPITAIADIFVPAGHGTKQTDDLIDIIINEFRSVQADGITYRVPSPEYVGLDNDKAHFHTRVTIPSYGEIVNV